MVLHAKIRIISAVPCLLVLIGVVVHFSCFDDLHSYLTISPMGGQSSKVSGILLLQSKPLSVSVIMQGTSLTSVWRLTNHWEAFSICLLCWFLDAGELFNKKISHFKVRILQKTLLRFKTNSRVTLKTLLQLASYFEMCLKLVFDIVPEKHNCFMLASVECSY